MLLVLNDLIFYKHVKLVLKGNLWRKQSLLNRDYCLKKMLQLNYKLKNNAKNHSCICITGFANFMTDMHFF